MEHDRLRASHEAVHKIVRLQPIGWRRLAGHDLMVEGCQARNSIGRKCRLYGYAVAASDSDTRRIEPPWVRRRPFDLSHAAMAGFVQHGIVTLLGFGRRYVTDGLQEVEAFIMALGVTVTVTASPVFLLVTLTVEPKGGDLCAAVMSLSLSG